MRIEKKEVLLLMYCLIAFDAQPFVLSFPLPFVFIDKGGHMLKQPVQSGKYVQKHFNSKNNCYFEHSLFMIKKCQLVGSVSIIKIVLFFK